MRSQLTTNLLWTLKTVESRASLRTSIIILQILRPAKSMMANDVGLRSSVICLGVVIIGVGIYTQSMKKMMGTYLFGMVGLCGILLPDWDYFDRPVSQWCSPITLNNNNNKFDPPTRFKLYPMRLIVYTLIYSYGLYKWWMFISN